MLPSRAEYREFALGKVHAFWAERPTWWKIDWGPLWEDNWPQSRIQQAIGCEHYWDFKDWPHLNKVVTKVTNLTKWHSGVHQLGLWINGRGKKAEWGRANGKRLRISSS